MIRLPIVRQKNDFSCGEAVVDSLLRHHGHTIRGFKFASAIDGTSPRTIEHQLRIHGFNVVAGNFGWDLTKHYIRKSTPVIVCMDGHWVVVCGIENRSVVLMDPDQDDYRRISIVKFKERWLDYDTVGTQYRNWGIAARAVT